MVTKLAFIGEGETESMVIKSEKFQKLLENYEFDFIGVRDAGGRGNFEKDNGFVDSLIKDLLKNGAERIFIISDLENYQCISEAKDSIATFLSTPEIIIIPKALEAWFLADSEALSKILNKELSYIFPEKTPSLPFDEINSLFAEFGINPVRSKVKLTKRFITHGLDVDNASKHQNCESAKYFIRKLKEFSEE
ncbi:MAG: hypothetical protein Q8M94_14305 [Ignavibacteria bacterium]|nr:hypothetical protein [Ignavibacteria bacterium]